MKPFSRLMRVSALIIGAFFSLSVSSSVAQPKKHVLLEESTGSWCQYCPRGATTMVGLIEKYPEDVIAVSVHNNDAMALTGESEFSTAYINGYPNGVIDRQFFAGHDAKSGLSDSDWETAILQRLAKPVDAAVEVKNVTYNPKTRELSFDVNANFVAAATGSYRFNAYVVEDSVTGTGTGYDQVNAFNTVSSSPWYQKGNPIVGFVHRHVLRAALGGFFGDAGSLPTNIVAGTDYKKTYTYKLPSNIDPSRATVVGFVMKYSTDAKAHTVVNAAEKKLTNLPRVAAFTFNISKPYATIARNGSKDIQVKVGNPNNRELPAHLEITGDLPTGWSATVSPEDVTIPANGSVDATVTFSAPAEAAFAGVNISATPAVDDAVGKMAETSAYALSENAKYVVLGGMNNYAPLYLQSLLNLNDYASDAVYLPMNNSVLQAYATQNFSTYIIPMGIQPAAVVVDYVKGLLAAGKNVLMTSSAGMFYTFDAGAPATYKTAAATDFYTNTLGLDYIRLNNYVSGNTLNSFNITGISNDTIGKNFSAAIGANTSVQVYSQYTESFRLAPGSKSKPVFYYGTNQNDLAAVRVESGNSKLVYMSFGLEATLGKQTDVMQRIMEYFVGTKKTASYSFDETNVDFGTITAGTMKEMTVTLTSDGGLPLEVSNVAITGENSSMFKLKNAPSLPKTLNAGESLTFTVEFAPTQVGEFNADLAVTTNSENSVTALLQGIASGVSVTEFDKESNDLLALSVGQNPVAGATTIGYTVKGNTAQTVELSIVDERGRVVMNFGKETGLGTVTKNFNAASLASGSYRLIARSNMTAVQMPLVIAH